MSQKEKNNCERTTKVKVERIFLEKKTTFQNHGHVIESQKIFQEPTFQNHGHVTALHGRKCCLVDMSRRYTAAHLGLLDVSQRYKDAHSSLMDVSQRYKDAHLSLMDVSQRYEDAKLFSGRPICPQLRFNSVV